MALPEGVRKNTAIQVELSDLFVEALGNERIRHGVIKVALI